MKSVEDAYSELGRSVLDFVSGRQWESGVCNCQMFTKMASCSWYIMSGNQKNAKAIGWGDTSIDSGGAALFLRDDLLKTTGKRIWGLTFTLYPNGKFNIEYDYNKPEDYEETDETIDLADAFKQLPGQ